MKNRVLAMVLAVLMALTLLPTMTFADETDTITVREQSGSPEYGTSVTSVYQFELSYENDADYSLVWYEDAQGKTQCTAPEGVTAYVEGEVINITNDKTTSAGTYYFKLSSGGIQSDVTAYTVAKRAASITSGSEAKVYDGTPLTCSEYVTKGFLDGEGVYVTCTGSVVDEGVASNTFTYNFMMGTDPDNYEITETEGELTVSDQLFVINAEYYNEKYDGEKHSFEVQIIGKNGIDYTSEATIDYKTSDTGLNGSWSDWSWAAPSIKDAGKLYIKVKATATINGVKKTIQSGVFTMEVTKRNVTLTSGSETWEYDGNSHSSKAMSVGADGFAGTEGASYSYTGTITKAGSEYNSFTYVLNNGAIDDNYNISKVEGTLTVTPKSDPITINTSSKTWKYDGQAHSACTKDDWGYVGNLVEGHTLDVNFKYTNANPIINAGTYANSLTSVVDPETQEIIKKAYRVTDENGEDVTDCYTFAEPMFGTLTIEKRDVTLTSSSDLRVKAQEGDYAYNDEVTETGDGLLTGEELVYSGFQKVTEITYTPTPNTFEYKAGEGSAFNADNYNIAVVTGNLMLVEELAISCEDQTFTYDGTEHSAPVTVIDNGKAPEVETTYSTSTDNKTWSEYTTTVPTVKDAGVLYVKVKAKKGVQEKDAAYTVTVNKRTVVISTASATKAYDGEALSKPKYTFGGDGLVSGEAIIVDVTGSQTTAGSSENSFIYLLDYNVNPDNYIIKEEPGTLTVTKNTKPITISTYGAQCVYNGVALRCADYTVKWGGSYVSDGELFDGDELQVVPTGSITDVGTAANECEWKVVNEAGADVTDSYTFAEPVYGTLEVTPRSVVINTESASKTYDGEPLTKSGYSVTGDDFISGQGFEKVNIVGTITNAGTAANVLDSTTPYTLKEGTNPDNYEITVNAGTLTVNKRKVTVTTGSAIKTSGPATSAVIDWSGDGFVSGEMTDGYPKCVGKQETTGQSSNYAEYKWTGNGNPANYDIVEQLGVLEVTDGLAAAGVANGYVGTYDGMEHTGSVTTCYGNATVKYSGDGGETYELPEAPKYKDAGTYTVYVKITSYDGTQTNYYTYQVEIEPRTVVLVSSDKSQIYNGEALTDEASNVTGIDAFVDGELAKINMTGKQTAAGSSENTFEVVLNDNAKASNYEIEYAYGTLTVMKRAVTVVSGSAVKTKSAMMSSGPAINAEVKVSGDGFIDGELQERYPKATGSQNEIGESANTIEFKWNGDFSADNYDITEVTGILKVVEDGEFAAVATGYEGVYDGKAHGGTVTPSIDGATVQYYVDGSSSPAPENPTFTNAGEHSITAVVSSGSNSCTVSYEVKISKRQATIYTQSASKTYDGEALTAPTFNLVGFVAGEGADVTITGSQKEAGTSKNTFTYTLTGGANKDNYVITEVPGTLTVNKRRVTIVSGNAIKTESAASSEPATNPTVSVTAGSFVNGQLGDGYPKATGKQKAIGESANTIEYKWQPGFSKDNYEITEELGRLIVVDDGLVVVTGYEGVYDGKAHSGSVVTVNDSVEIWYYVDGSQTYVQENPTFTDVGTHTVRVVADQGEQIYYEREFTVKITQRPITITAGSATKVYDGKSLTCKDYTIGGDGFANDAEKTDANVKTEGSITDVASVSNEIMLSNSGSFKTENYKISIVAGTLEVTRRPVVLVSDGFTTPVTFTYDGEEHSSTAVKEVGTSQIEGTSKISGMGFAEGEGATYSDFAKAKDAGLYVNSFKYQLNDGTESKNYDIKTVYGIIEIEPANVSVFDVEPIDDQTYSGMAIEPELTVEAGDKILTEGIDYTVTYENNVNAGTATAIITGQGNYTGTREVTFTIKGKSASRLIVSEIESETYTGSEIKPEVTVEDESVKEVRKYRDSSHEEYDDVEVATGSRFTVATTDYTVSYKNNINAGTASVIITGRNYEGTKEATFAITAKALTGATVDEIKSQVYTGAEVKPEVTVKDGTKVLEADTDYTVSYSNNINIGTATAVITGKGNYKGTRTATFKIEKAEMEVTLDQTEFTYNGKEQVPNYTVKGIGGQVLTEGVDFEVSVVGGVASKKVNAGEVEIIFSSKNASYKDAKATYTIKPAKLKMTLSQNSFVYNGEEQVPEVTVTGVEGDDLKEGTDYQVTIGQASRKNAGTYTVTVASFNDNYEAADAATYTIAKRNVTVTSADAIKVYDGEALTDKRIVKVAGDGFVAGETGTFKFTGSQTKPGTSQNTFECSWKGTADENNYEVSYVYGTLTVLFTDVTADTDYWYNPVNWAAAEGITKGFADGHFGAEETCTRREIMIFIWRQMGCQEGTIKPDEYFNDWNIKKYPETSDTYKAVSWGISAGITKGFTDGSFRSESEVTRKDAIIMIYRAAGKPQWSATRGEMKFTDVKGIYGETTDTYNAICWAYNNRITNGFSSGEHKGKFGCMLTCLRKDIVTFLYRYAMAFDK